MNGPWRVEAWRVVFLVVAALLIGAISGNVVLAFGLIFFCYTLYLLRQLYRLRQWLSTGNIDFMPDDSGIVGSVAVQIYALRKRDNKRKKSLAILLARFRKSTAALPDGTVVLSSEHNIEWFNKAAAAILGLKSRDQGQHIGNFVRSPNFTLFLSKGVQEKTVTITSPYDSRITLEIRLIPYGDGLTLLLARDITRVVETQRMRRDFIANASHELRTPITVIKGYIEMLSGNKNDSEFLGTALQKITGQVGHMQQLVDDLLTLSQLENKLHHSHVQPIDMQKFCQQLHQDALLQAKPKAHHVSLECETGIYLKADEKDLRSVFNNLIANAIRYSPTEGTLVIRWYITDTAAIYEVEDNGIGLAKADIPRLVERFYRVNSSAIQRQNGTGLGLSIVKHILDGYDARLEVESTLGKGSTFRCCFPLSLIEVEEFKSVTRLS